jgi:hypothetical protein
MTPNQQEGVGGKPFWGDNQEFYASETFRRIARGELSVGTID